MLEHLLLSFQHRAGVRPYTSCCHLAESCVFSKQFPPLILCQQKRNEVLGRASTQFLNLPSLLPKLRDQFAEFLHHGSLNAFVFSTCSPVSVYSTVITEFRNLNSFFLVFSRKKNSFQSTIQSRRKFFFFVTKKSYPSNIVFTIFS